MRDTPLSPAAAQAVLEYQPSYTIRNYSLTGELEPAVFRSFADAMREFHIHEEFVERMKELATGKLRSFKEAALGHEIRVFGNVAAAVAVCQITENETQVTRGIEMMLLLKTEGRWQIVSQAWDTESESKPIPADLLGSD
jgi:hypothetical protein